MTTNNLLIFVVAAALVGLLLLTQIAHALTEQEQINQLTEQAKHLKEDAQSIQDWQLIRTDRAIQIQNGINNAFPNGLPKECSKSESTNDAEHSYLMIIKCVVK